MTDMTDLKAELSVMLANVQTAVDGTTVNLGSIENRLGYLWQQQDQAGNADACSQITAAWTEIQQIAKHNAALTTHVAAVTKVASTAIKQRDTALDNLDAAQGRADEAESDLDELREAITEVYHDGWTNNLELRDIVEVITDGIYSEGMHIDDPADRLIENGWGNLLNTDMVQWLFRALFEMNADEFPAVLQEEFAQLVNTAGQLVFQHDQAMSQASHVDLDAEPEGEEAW